MEPADARRMSVDQLFERQQFEKTVTEFLVLKESKKGLAKDKTISPWSLQEPKYLEVFERYGEVCTLVVPRNNNEIAS